MKSHTLAVAALVLALANFAHAQPATQPTTLPYATAEGQMISLHPSEATLRAPRDWNGQTPLLQFIPYLTRSELETVRNGDRSWRGAFTQIVNAALPFESCAVQFGNQAWERSSGLNVRAYVIDGPMDAVQKNISDKSLAEVAKLPARSSRPPTIEGPAADMQQWAKTKLDLRLSFGDAVGDMQINYFTKQFGDKTAVLVFMHIGNRIPAESWISEIVDSFHWPKTMGSKIFTESQGSHPP